MLRQLAAELRARTLGQIQKESKDALLLQGRIASWLARSKETITSLRDVEFKVLFQFGEDGIIDWIIERSQIPDRLHSFIEFGVELYEEANTRFLLENRNWRGLTIDANSQLETKVRNRPLAWRHTLQAKSAFITRENINQLFDECGFSGEIGLLSIDIDGNDYWVWEAIESVDPVITICEYNAHPCAAQLSQSLRWCFNRGPAITSNPQGVHPQNGFLFRIATSDRAVPVVNWFCKRESLMQADFERTAA
jgi:hypothetical protein